MFSVLLCGLLLWASPAVADSAEDGRAVMQAQGCIGCHSTDGTARVGPSFADLYGQEREGVTVDEAYLRRAIAEPDTELSPGFAGGMMPTMPLTEEQTNDVISALKDLSDNPDPVEPTTLLWLILGSVGFVAAHLIGSSHPVREPLVKKMGANAFMGLYSVWVAPFLALIIWGWMQAPFIPLWDPVPWTRWVPLLTMPFILVLWIAGMTTVGPTMGGFESRLDEENPVRGVLAITRHPANLAQGAWALVHLVPNGDLASLFFFGGFATLSVVGSMHIDQRRRRAFPESWAAFESRTSLFPFVAIAGGRASLSLREIGWWRVALGLVIYLAIVLTHAWTMGVSPFPISWGM